MAHPAERDVEDVAFAKASASRTPTSTRVTSNLRVKATPTLVLVNQQGEILACLAGRRQGR
jgi:thioredoxin-related protein